LLKSPVLGTRNFPTPFFEAPVRSPFKSFSNSSFSLLSSETEFLPFISSLGDEMLRLLNCPAVSVTGELELWLAFTSPASRETS